MRTRGPKGAVSVALREGLAEHKADLFDLLGGVLLNDPELTDEARVQADLPNATEAIRAYLEAQKARAA